MKRMALIDYARNTVVKVKLSFRKFSDEISSQRTVTLNFIVLLRGIAPLLVMWDHLVAWPVNKFSLDWPIYKFVDTLITKPFNICWNFGWLGILIFFLISGFIITHAAQSETRLSFFTKRVFRIYPPLIVSILIAASLQAYFGDVTESIRYTQDFSLINIFYNMTLLNWVITPGKGINSVTWTLVTEEVFYFLCFLCLPLLKNRPNFAMASIGLFCLSIAFIGGQMAGELGQWCFNVSYLLLGQVIYYLWTERITFLSFIIFTSMTFLIIILNADGLLDPVSGFGTSLIYAYFIFVTALFLNKRIRLANIFGFFALISYSLYLNHVVLGRLVIRLLLPKLGFSLAFIFSLGAVVVLSYYSYLLIEDPSRKLARKLLG